MDFEQTLFDNNPSTTLEQDDASDDCDSDQGPSDNASTQDSNSGLSKKALKRLKRREHFAMAKKAKKQKKKEDRLQKIASGELPLRKPSDPSLVPPTEVIHQNRVERKQAKNDAYLAACKESFDVIIDCAWENEHTESTLASLTQQIMFCYGLNKRYEKPSLLHLSNLGTATQYNLSKVKFENWVGVTHSSGDYLEEQDRYCIEPCPGKKQLVYLTSDADEVLETLEPSCAYIIGGIVDRNRLKGVTYQKAVSQGIRTAKLPIKEYFSLSATHVLTVNHVFEILLKYNILKSWPETLAAILPKRKEPTKKEDGHAEDVTSIQEQQKSDLCDDEEAGIENAT
jgi:tRNA (guanine9-N1)-methyltransferase